MPKNVFLSKDRLAEIEQSVFSRSVGYFQSVDKESMELFDKLNPVLSDGHRRNVITFLVDKNVPREVAELISQMLVSVPVDSRPNSLSDEDIERFMVSRDFQNEIELDMVRSGLEIVANELYPDASLGSGERPEGSGSGSGSGSVASGSGSGSSGSD